jgi:hypothetical protein
MLAVDLVIQPPSAEVSLEVAVGGTIRPSTTHWMEEAGLELEVRHSRLRVSLILAVSGPGMVSVSGATEILLKRRCQEIIFWLKMLLFTDIHFL